VVCNRDGRRYRPSGMSVARVAGACIALILLIGGCTGDRKPTASPTAPAVSYQAPPIAGCHHSTGRSGQNRAMVPGKPTSLTVCSARSPVPGEAGPKHTFNTVTGAALAHLVGVLDAGHLRPTTITSCDAGGLARTYTLDFTYADGPDVAVDVGPDCHPSISNGTVATDNTHDVMVAIDALIGVTCSELIC
jgi:hypothetical protein